MSKRCTQSGTRSLCAEFLEHQRSIGNDLGTPMPQYRFPGLNPGDRWCVTAANWLRAHLDGAAAPVVLACTNERALDIVPLELLQEHEHFPAVVRSIMLVLWT